MSNKSNEFIKEIKDVLLNWNKQKWKVKDLLTRIAVYLDEDEIDETLEPPEFETIPYF